MTPSTVHDGERGEPQTSRCPCHRFESRVLAGEGAVALHAFHAGDPADDAVVLLHGFPDCAYTWRRQNGPLAAEGFYVVALDLRGAGRSSTPLDPEAYHLRRFVADLKAVVATLRNQSSAVHLVAHDFGAHVAWLTAMDIEVDSLAVISGAHPAHARILAAVPSRMGALAHVGLLQLPGVAEALLTPEVLVDVLRMNIRNGQFDACDVEHYLAAFRRPSVRAAMFQWYRQLTRAAVFPPRLKPTQVNNVRVLTVVGRSDPFLDRRLVEPPPSWVRPPAKNVQRTGGHWLHWDRPDECTTELVAHLRDRETRRAAH